MHSVIPSVPIKQIIKNEERSIAKPINPSDIVADLNFKERKQEKLLDDDPMMFHLLTGENKEEEKKVVNVIINNGSFEEQITDMMDDALFDFEDLPSVQDSKNKRAEQIQYNETTSRKSIKGYDRSYSKMTRQVCNITKS